VRGERRSRKQQLVGGGVFGGREKQIYGGAAKEEREKRALC
jgi:hypothetical protein